MQPECLFCKISRNPDTVIWENENFAAFKDIHPKARVHVLVVPKTHIDTLDDVPSDLAAGLIEAIQEVAKQQNVSGAYKIHFNVGAAAGQEINHVHAHILAA